MKKILLFLMILSIFNCSKKQDIQEEIKENMIAEQNIFTEDVDIVFGTGEWAPYTSAKIEDYGIFTEIVSAACKAANLTFTYKFYPWKRCEVNLQNGELFAIFPYMKTPERESIFNFSDSVMENNMVMFYRKSVNKNINWKTFEDFKEYKIGGVLGYWYETEFKNANLIMDYASSDSQNLIKLANGRIDYAASEDLVGWDVIIKEFPDSKNDFATVKKPLKTGSLYIMVSKDYPNSDELLKRFNQGLSIIRTNGKYSEIMLNKFNK